MTTKPVFYLIIISLLWAGMIMGISFLEAPVKFTAPSLTLAIGLDVGRHVFAIFNRVEIIFGTILAIIIITGRLPLAIWSLCLLVTILLSLECFWLLPELDKRALAIIAGENLKGASPHIWYVIFDGLKIISLIAIGAMSIKHIIKLQQIKE